MKILIKGYYGFGNLGDDILMLISYQYLKKQYPQASYYVYTNSANSGYIGKLLNDHITLIDWSYSGHFDLIFHGGGGTYFDFASGSIFYKSLNTFIDIIGYRKFSTLFTNSKKLLKRPVITCDRRIGVGIGIGRFTSSSTKFYQKILELVTFDRLYIRHPLEGQFLDTLRKKIFITTSTDLAFSANYWLNPEALEVKNTYDVAFILRDWHYDGSSYLLTMQSIINKLRDRGLTVKVFGFDKNYDTQLQIIFPDLIIWSPQDMTVSDFINKLSQSSVIVSSRAHGAILGSCLNKWSICLAIEPKLQTVHNMLPNATDLIHDFNREDSIINLISKRLNHHPNVSINVSDNQNTIEKSLSELSDYLQKQV